MQEIVMQRNEKYMSSVFSLKIIFGISNLTIFSPLKCVTNTANRIGYIYMLLPKYGYDTYGHEYHVKSHEFTM